MDKKLAKAGDLIGERFKLSRYINSGGQGEVWEGKDTISSNAKVAIKLFPEGPLSRAKNEVNALSNIKHEKIVKFIDTNISPDEIVEDGCSTWLWSMPNTVT
jgi:serine/threonine protein kinase